MRSYGQMPVFDRNRRDLTPLVSALTRELSRKSFRIGTYRKPGGGAPEGGKKATLDDDPKTSRFPHPNTASFRTSMILQPSYLPRNAPVRPALCNAAAAASACIQASWPYAPPCDRRSPSAEAAILQEVART